jgi:hypothetical protein
MDQTRPLNLPPALLGSVNDMMQTLERDPKAPKWVNALERSLTRRKEASAAGAPP